MSDDEESELNAEFDEYEDESPAYKWSKDRTVYLALEFSAALAQNTAIYLAKLSDQAGADHNYKVDAEETRDETRRFLDAAREEIETLPTFTDGTEDG